MAARKSIVFTVSNDLSFDQRMDRICATLQQAGYPCTLVGRMLPDSMPLAEKPYAQRRLRCWFTKGKLFYIEYNVRLFLFLVRNRSEIIYSVDVDTALPGIWASNLKKCTWVFDAHEYFSELEEVISRPVIHRFWKWAERKAMKRAQHAITISEGYAKLFKDTYGTAFKVVRNVPIRRAPDTPSELNARYLIYQGALNIGRGLEASIRAMHQIEGLRYKIYGEGPIRSQLEALIARERLEDRVELCGGVRPEELRKQTAGAFAGFTLFSQIGLHHAYSFANRFFDYIHAGIPQIAMDYPEYRSFNEEYGIALLIPTLDPDQIASAINQLLRDEALHERMRSNTDRAKEENNWQLESSKLLEFFDNL